MGLINHVCRKTDGQEEEQNDSRERVKDQVRYLSRWQKYIKEQERTLRSRDLEKLDRIRNERIRQSMNVERGSSVIECRIRNQVSPGSNPPLLPFRRLGIFLLSIDAPVDSAV